jgi:hypothetical protein
MTRAREVNMLTCDDSTDVVDCAFSLRREVTSIAAAFVVECCSFSNQSTLYPFSQCLLHCFLCKSQVLHFTHFTLVAYDNHDPLHWMRKSDGLLAFSPVKEI